MSKPIPPGPRGVWIAALTPMQGDGSPNGAAFARHCRWLLDNGADGLAVLGTTGEANSFSVAERHLLLDALAEGGIPGSTLLPGVGCCAIPDTVELTRKALAVGSAGVVMLPPFYYKNVSDDGLFAAYSEVIQRVGDGRLKVYFYHFPAMSNVPISHALIERLLKAYPATIAGIKDSSGDLANMLAMCERFPGFGGFAGSEQFLLPVLRAGGAGCISATANVTIATCAAVYKAWQTSQADALQEGLTTQRLIIQARPLVPALKRITAERTGDRGWLNLRPPLAPLGEAEAKQLFADLDKTGFVLPKAA
jgi:4-hydroxy-tetrahydrodipicolinate synthase